MLTTYSMPLIFGVLSLIFFLISISVKQGVITIPTMFCILCVVSTISLVNVNASQVNYNNRINGEIKTEKIIKKLKHRDTKYDNKDINYSNKDTLANIRGKIKENKQREAYKKHPTNLKDTLNVAYQFNVAPLNSQLIRKKIKACM